MDFVSHLDGVPLTRETRLKLQRYARAQIPPLSEEAAAGYAIERFMREEGEQATRIAEAKKTAGLYIVKREVG